MNDLKNKIVKEVFWLTNQLGICTNDDFLVYFYDDRIYLNNKILKPGEPLENRLLGKEIAGLTANESGFKLFFKNNDEIAVKPSSKENARIHQEEDFNSHYIYVNGKLEKEG